MKSEKKKLEKQRASTRELIGIEAILKDGIRTASGDLVFFLLKPTNIAVLSDASTEARVMALTDVLKGFPDLEMVCYNSREDFEGNKRYLMERAAVEQMPKILNLLHQDHQWIDTVQASMATAREFAIALRLVPEKNEELPKPAPAPGGRVPYKAGAPAARPPGQIAARPDQTAKRPPKAALILARLEKALKGRGFSVRAAGSQEIMRLLAVYFAQNVTTERFEDYDGQRFGLLAS